PPPASGPDTPNDSEAHQPATSAILTMHQEYARIVRNRDGLSGILIRRGFVDTAGRTHLNHMEATHEDAGIETKG
ncbi:MAG: hypothetical protein ACYCZY_13320, partial [Lacisediminihabitans sp.]